VNFYTERELLGHSGDVTAIAWSSNGQWIASGSQDNTTRIWSSETWDTVKTLHHSGAVKEVSFAKNALRFAVSLENGTIEIWNSAGWSLSKNLTEHSDTVSGLDWSPDGTMLATGDSSGNVKIWDTTTWNSMENLVMTSGVMDLRWSNTGDKLAASFSNGTIGVWETSTWANIQFLIASAGDEGVASIAWSPDDSELASSSEDNKVRVWSTVSWEAIQTFDTESPPKEVDWSFDGSFLAVAVVGGIASWDTTEWGHINSTELSDETQVAALAFDPEGDGIATSAPSNSNNAVLIWVKNFSPILDPIGNRTALEDQPFSMTVSATDDDELTYSDDSSLFDIDPVTGQVSFVPTNYDVGEHTVNITVSDGMGGMDSETVLFTIVNVDDPPVPVLNWHYGADYLNITLMVGGQIGNSVTLTIEEDETPLNEITVERKSGTLDEKTIQLHMNHSSSYEAELMYSGGGGQNPVAVIFEHGGIAHTKHVHFDSASGVQQVENLHMSEFFGAMGLVVFDASASTDVDSEIVRYLWDFGNGNKGEGIGTAHHYSENGDYTPSLRVEADNGINSSISDAVSLHEIPNRDDVESELNEDITLSYLESTDYRASFIEGRKTLKLTDSSGKITGYSEGSFKFEIDEVYLAYSCASGEVYYKPNDLELTYSIMDVEEDYELQIFIPSAGMDKVIGISGDGGGDAIDVNKEGDVFSIATSETEKNYSLEIEGESASGKESFTLTNMNIGSPARHQYTVNNWEDLTGESKAVTLDIDSDNDGEIDLSLDLESGMTGEEVEAIIIAKGQPSSPLLSTSGVILLVGFVSLVGIGCLLGSTEVGKLALLSLILPLYTRLKKEEVLDNEIRGMIRGYIIANPGDNYNSIKRALGVNNGALAYHLKVLERAKLIRSRQDGMFRRFYPSGMRIPRENGGEISEIQRILLSKIGESPGISQKEIANLLKLSKGVINYHVKVLLNKKMIRLEKKGRKTHCYVDAKTLPRIKDTSVDKLKEM
ncbi:MAG: winged helix-turn-helix transcriptional regulator, partial [Thermoplasmata archaeon]